MDSSPLPPNRIMISSVRLERAEHHGRDHDEVTIWNRGGMSGILHVAPGDGKVILAVLRRASGPASVEPIPPEVVSSAVSRFVGGHDRVEVFNRGKRAGELIVTKGDGETIARVLRGGEAGDVTSATRGAQRRKADKSRSPGSPFLGIPAANDGG